MTGITSSNTPKCRRPSDGDTQMTDAPCLPEGPAAVGDGPWYFPPLRGPRLTVECRGRGTHLSGAWNLDSSYNSESVGLLQIW